MCLWNFEFFWNVFPARVEQSFEKDKGSSARRAGGTTPVSQEECRRRTPLLKTPTTESATDSANF